MNHAGVCVALFNTDGLEKNSKKVNPDPYWRNEEEMRVVETAWDASD